MKLMTTKRDLPALQVISLGLGLGLGLATLAACGAGHTTNSGVIEGAAGSPLVHLGGQSGPTTVIATLPNPCEIDLDFGSVPIGMMTSVVVQIENSGRGALDLSPVSPTLDPQFVLNDGTQPPIQPGSFGAFSVAFEPGAIGAVESTFAIPTDGVNSSCPPPDEGSGAVVTVKLAGNGATSNP